MENIIALTLFYALLELFEARWQQAPTLLLILTRIRSEYEKNIFRFFFLHPTYYFAIWLILHTQLCIPSVILLFLKTVDISTKIVLMQQVFEKKEVSEQLHDMLMMPLEKWMPYMGLAVYTPLVLWALL
ncbi:MAG TPA: hypothetical protein ENL04_03655 [Sulfuricurvum sp.]|nr:hypothetical protein [Sulfuricurvum sp.]